MKNNKEICDACSQEVIDIQSTPWVGSYCIDCHRLVILESKEAIKILRLRKKSRSIKDE